MLDGEEVSTPGIGASAFPLNEYSSYEKITITRLASLDYAIYMIQHSPMSLLKGQYLGLPHNIKATHKSGKQDSS